MWQWFLKNGDKLLAWATGVVALAQTQGVMDGPVLKYTTFALASLTMLHNTFLPEPKETTK